MSGQRSLRARTFLPSPAFSSRSMKPIARPLYRCAGRRPSPGDRTTCACRSDRCHCRSVAWSCVLDLLLPPRCVLCATGRRRAVQQLCGHAGAASRPTSRRRARRPRVPLRLRGLRAASWCWRSSGGTVGPALPLLGAALAEALRGHGRARAPALFRPDSRRGTDHRVTWARPPAARRRRRGFDQSEMLARSHRGRRWRWPVRRSAESDRTRPRWAATRDAAARPVSAFACDRAAPRGGGARRRRGHLGSDHVGGCRALRRGAASVLGATIATTAGHEWWRDDHVRTAGRSTAGHPAADVRGRPCPGGTTPPVVPRRGSDRCAGRPSPSSRGG